MPRKKSVVREYLEAIVIAVVLALLIRHFVIQAFKIPSGSMIPTLLVGDHLLVNKFIYRFREPQRGEIVVFKFPQDRKTDFIKRVIALPGEEIAIRDTRLFINGEELEDQNGRYEPSVSPGRERSFKPFHVPHKGDMIRPVNAHVELYSRLIANETDKQVRFAEEYILIGGERVDAYQVQNDYIFMMGDNRDNSYDSRFWGPVNTADVVGKALIIYWSFGDTFYHIRWSRIGDLIQ